LSEVLDQLSEIERLAVEATEEVFEEELAPSCEYRKEEEGGVRLCLLTSGFCRAERCLRLRSKKVEGKSET